DLGLIRPVPWHGGRRAANPALREDDRLAFRPPRGQLHPQRIPPLRTPDGKHSSGVMPVTGDVIPAITRKAIPPCCVLSHQNRKPYRLKGASGTSPSTNPVPRYKDVLRTRVHSDPRD